MMGWRCRGRGEGDKGLTAMQLVRDKGVLYGEGDDGFTKDKEEEENEQRERE